MTTGYWIEMTLKVSGGSSVEKLATLLDEQHAGQVVYTFSALSRKLNLAIATRSDEPIEQIVPQMVGLVRAAAHELGIFTPDWPEPVTIDDVRIKTLDAATAVY